MVTTCGAAEEAGASAIWASDHLFWRRPGLECLTTLAAAAGAARRAVIGSCVLQLPLRSTAAVAKQASSLQLLSDGRFVLGVGVGSHAGEYARAGADYSGRGRRLEAGVRDLRRYWANDGASPGYGLLPALAPPVWFGGSSAAARGRAARLGDGWIPLFLPAARFAHDVVLLRDEAIAARRDPGDVLAAAVVVVSVGRTGRAAAGAGLAWLSDLYGLAPEAFERHLVAGTAERCAEAVSSYLDAGAEHVVLMVAGDDPVEAFSATAAALGAPASPDLCLAGVRP